MQELSDATKKLIKQYDIAKKSGAGSPDGTTIHVDEVAKKVAAFYEQIRTIVDWKEEHLMRRAAIIRKLKVSFLDLELNNFTGTENVADNLVVSLVRGGHFPNDKIEETKISHVQNVINKYVFTLKNNPENKKGKAGIIFYNWLIEVAACEIEETLAPYIKELALIDYMFKTIKSGIKVSDKIFESGLLQKDSVDLQIHIAVQLSLFKLDKPMISYNLIKYWYPNWYVADEALALEVSQNIFKIYRRIEQELENPLANKFYNICERYDTPYLLMGDILSSGIDFKEITDPTIMEGKIKTAYSKRLSTLKKRLSRAAIYSIISIFVTKILSLLLLEILIEKATKHGINIYILIADILIPTILMFLMVISVRRPSKKNLSLVTLETMKIVYKNSSQDVYEIRLNRKKGFFMKIILSLMYIMSAIVSFGAIYYVLNYFKFPITSIIIDVIFIALILFAGTAVSKRAQELTMEEDKEGFLSFLSDVFFLPAQGLGKWISNKWKRYNVLTALFNALVDMPFSAFVEFLEKWRYFIKEKKEEIR